VARGAQCRPLGYCNHCSSHGNSQTDHGSGKVHCAISLFQLAVVVAVILFLQAGDDKSARGQMFNGLDELVESTVGLFSAAFNVKCFTKSWLTTGFWIASGPSAGGH
jgi:hypothetical protein